MIKIQVLGSGMIPRDLGIAPRKEPFYADRDVIYTILNTPGLSVNYLHPENGRFFPLTRDNMKKILDKFKNASYDKPKTVTPPSRPHVPEEPKKEDPKPEEKKAEEKKQTPPVTPPPAPAEPPKPTTPPQPVNTPKAETKTEEPKKEDPKPEEKKAEEKKEEKKEDKPATSGLKPVVASEKK